MANPVLVRECLFHLRSSPQPAYVPFWKLYRQVFSEFVETDASQPGIDVDVHTVLMLLSSFLWPVWARAHARTAKEREQMAQRYTNEVVRLSMYGTMRPEKYPELAAHLARIAPAKPARKSVKKPAKPAAKKAVKKAPAGKSRSK